VAALIAPATAAVFAGTMSWSAGHPPATAATLAKASAPLAAAGSTGHDSDADLDQQIAAQTAQVKALRTQVAILRNEVAALKGTPAKASTQKTTTGRSTATARRNSGSSGSSAPAPRAASAPAPAPAPATNTTTGGS
jgi:TolA-binding protein